jgi:hypothetical protein
MEWFERLGAMYQFLNNAPPLAQQFSTAGPQTDLGYLLAYASQNTSTPLDVYPADAAGE